MKKVINSFTDEYRFLSNFLKCDVAYDDLEYSSVEHAYQAAKTIDSLERYFIKSCLTAGQAKRAGKKVTMRSDWEEIKLSVMEDLLRQKFAISGFKNSLKKQKVLF